MPGMSCPGLFSYKHASFIPFTQRLVTAGSSSQCGVNLPEHFPGITVRFLFSGGGYSIKAMSQLHPVRINGETLQSETNLEHGDLIDIEACRFRFLMNEEPSGTIPNDVSGPVAELISTITVLLGNGGGDCDIYESLVTSVARLLKCDAARLLGPMETAAEPVILARYPSGASLGRFSKRALKWASTATKTVLAGSDEWEDDHESVNSLMRNSVGSLLCTPLMQEDNRMGFLYLDRLRGNRPFTQDDRNLCDSLKPLFEQILKNDTIKREQRKTIALLQESAVKAGNRIIHQSVPMHRVLRTAEQISKTDMPILLQGETGTGKELFAKFIVESSRRSGEAFIAVNCGAIPENLIESELFGHEKGAFTGAVSRKTGSFEAAHKGTLFLDEIGELPLAVQARLLRVLQEGEVTRVGNSRPVKIDIRVISATNKDLRSEVEKGLFREDLFFRLHVLDIKIPPLRERGKDVLLIANYFLTKYSRQFGVPVKRFTPGATKKLQAHSWPGNIRELDNFIQKTVLLTAGNEICEDTVDLDNSHTAAMTKTQINGTLREIRDRAYMEAVDLALKRWSGNVSLAAKHLDINRSWLTKLLKEMKIDPGDYRKRNALAQ